jgi:alpha-L-fucosidase 2
MKTSTALTRRRIVFAHTFLVAFALAFAPAFAPAFASAAANANANAAAADPAQALKDLRLWYRAPAAVWTEALPVGNGSMGAMVFGGIAQDRIQFNHDTLWTGQPRDYQHPGAAEVLPELRRLLQAGQQREAEALANNRFMSEPLRQCAYQPLGDLWIEMGGSGHDNANANANADADANANTDADADAKDYERALDLDQAVATTSYRIGDVRYTRSVLASHPAGVIVVNIKADRPGCVTFAARLSSPHDEYAVAAVTDATANAVTDANANATATALILTGRVNSPQKNGMRFAARLEARVEGAGAVRADGGILQITGADAATLVLTADTSFVNYHDISADPTMRVNRNILAARGKDFAALRAAHVADHRSLFRRTILDLGRTDAADLPTDRRLAATDKTGDPQLASLLFSYGRYLLIASSRPGSQAANLQGVWNDKLNPSWGSKYTTNINLEMNYWPVEVANLPELTGPLFSLLDDVVVSGRRTAGIHYNARGWVLHHNTDLWRGTAPINNSNHGIWPTGGAWLCIHLWDHYLFSGDREFLARRAYPVMRAASEFFLDTLVEDPATKQLISGPSNSPEHGGLVMGPAMDHQIIRGLLAWTASAARVLGVDADFAAQLDATRNRIAPNRIGRHGQLQEWMEDNDNPKDTHRHVSHLWGVFPGDDITWADTAMMAAARQSLEFRGDGGTGWAIGWKIALWARLRDGARAHRILLNQLAFVQEPRAGEPAKPGGGTYPNFFGAHPPFQIDGNFAATAGILELLAQSTSLAADGDGGGRPREIVLLPALPPAWKNGSVTGVRLRGGFDLDLAWKNGELHTATVRSRLGRPLRLVCGGRVVETTIPAGESRTFSHALETSE